MKTFHEFPVQNNLWAECPCTLPNQPHRKHLIELRLVLTPAQLYLHDPKLQGSTNYNNRDSKCSGIGLGNETIVHLILLISLPTGMRHIPAYTWIHIYILCRTVYMHIFIPETIKTGLTSITWNSAMFSEFILMSWVDWLGEPVSSTVMVISVISRSLARFAYSVNAWNATAVSYNSMNCTIKRQWENLNLTSDRLEFN